MMAATPISGVTWRVSSYSGGNGGECVEVGNGLPDVLPVRDSKQQNGPILSFPTPAWSSFIATLKGDIHPS